MAAERPARTTNRAAKGVVASEVVGSAETAGAGDEVACALGRRGLKVHVVAVGRTVRPLLSHFHNDLCRRRRRRNGGNMRHAAQGAFLLVRCS